MADQLAKIVFLGLVASNVAFAEVENVPDWNVATFSGDWGGIRSSLYDKGIAVELIHKSDVMAVVSGGIKRGSAWMGNTE